MDDMNVDLPDLPTDLPISTSTPPAIGSTSDSKKRVVLSQEAHGSITTRTSDDEATLLEVDHMILDYLMHQAITTCFATAHQFDASSVDEALIQVNDFRQLFSARHPDYSMDNELRFRQVLLQLTALATQRFIPHKSTPPPSSLAALRARNSARARTWIETASRMPTAKHDLTPFDADLPLDQATLFGNRTSFLRSLELPVHSAQIQFFGSPESLTLLDLLPLFMRVSAASCETLYEGEINDQWMRLASQWMFQACLEQYLICGMSGSDALDEAFAWGYKRGNAASGAEEEVDNGMVNSMFEDSQYAQEVEGWSQWKEKALHRLLSHGEQDIRSHLAALAELNPMRQFSETVLQYLEALSKSIPKPVLLQLENGKLDGLSEQSTKQFLKDCGVGERGFGAML